MNSRERIEKQIEGMAEEYDNDAYHSNMKFIMELLL